MATTVDYRPEPGTIPTQPGVYTFRDAHDRVIYVGKAKNLRARLGNYFQDLHQLHPRTRAMVTSATRVVWTVVSSELEALNLEYTWIKRFNPRFNVMYRDDKTYPMLAISIKEEIPRAFVYRGARRKGIRYFGPYPKVWAIRETLDSLTRVFPIRTCSPGVYRRHQQLGRPCLLGYIDKCTAPCVGNISATDHRQLVDKFSSFLAGNTTPVLRAVRHDMESAAENLDFEKAAQLRDQLAAMEKAMEKQAVVFSDSTEADVIAVIPDELEAAIQVFHVRGGRIHGQRGWVVERDDDDNATITSQFLTQFYGEEAELARATATAAAGQPSAGINQHHAAAINPAAAAELGNLIGDVQVTPIPKEILVEDVPENAEELMQWLSQLRGTKVTIRQPLRGDKKTLMETAKDNATQALAQHKLKRSADITARSAALRELQEALGMQESPLRIECTDISHIQGTDVVASLVVFEDALPKKADYRRYKITDAAGDGHSNDVASIAEVVQRRFKRYLQDNHSLPLGDATGDLLEGEEDLDQTLSDEAAAAGNPSAREEVGEGGVEMKEKEEKSASSAPRKTFAYPPQLFIVDGGLAQVNAARKVLDTLGITDITLVGIAKRLEELWLPGQDYPVILPRTSPALYLVQNLRDEAHRFAITFHRQQRSARMRRSVLDDIPGLGPQRRKKLVKAFGSVARVREASVEDLATLPGFGSALANKIYQALHPQAATSD